MLFPVADFPLYAPSIHDTLKRVVETKSFKSWGIT